MEKKPDGRRVRMTKMLLKNALIDNIDYMALMMSTISSIVDTISYSKEREIISLVIRNTKTNEICFQMKDNRNATVELIEKAKSVGVNLEKVCSFYGAKIPADLKYYQLESSINAKLKAGGIK